MASVWAAVLQKGYPRDAYRGCSLHQVERVNRTTTAMLKKMLLDKKEKNWPDYINTVAWNTGSNIHKSANFKPIHLLIGQGPKLPPECEQLDLDIMKNPDLMEEQVEKIIEETMNHNLSKYKALYEPNEANADINIFKKSVPTKEKL